MIPLRDVIPSRTTPYVTVTIIILNALAWFYELSLPREDLPVFLQLFGVVPAAFSPPTLVSSMFLHGSWSHVIGNMWYLWIFGDNVEDRLGHGRFIVFYLLCGIVAAFGQIVHRPAVDAADDRRERRDRRRDGRLLRALSAVARADADSADHLLGDHRAAGDHAARLLVPDAAVQRRRDRRHREHAGGGGVAFMAHVAGFVDRA